jgi:hypothetical protein
MKAIRPWIQNAIRAAGCRHEFTYWEPKTGTNPKQWKRICTKCKVRETRVSEIEPKNY